MAWHARVQRVEYGILSGTLVIENTLELLPKRDDLFSKTSSKITVSLKLKNSAVHQIV